MKMSITVPWLGSPQWCSGWLISLVQGKSVMKSHQAEQSSATLGRVDTLSSVRLVPLHDMSLHTQLWVTSMVGMTHSAASKQAETSPPCSSGSVHIAPGVIIMNLGSLGASGPLGSFWATLMANLLLYGAAEVLMHWSHSVPASYKAIHMFILLGLQSWGDNCIMWFKLNCSENDWTPLLSALQFFLSLVS